MYRINEVASVRGRSAFGTRTGTGGTCKDREAERAPCCSPRDTAHRNRSGAGGVLHRRHTAPESAGTVPLHGRIFVSAPKSGGPEHILAFFAFTCVTETWCRLRRSCPPEAFVVSFLVRP